jgi:hypothetical protein
MNPILIKELIEFYPSQVEYLAIYFDEERGVPFWVTGRIDAPMNTDNYISFLDLAGLHNETRSIERDANWILVNTETGEISVLPWQEADTKLQQQFKDDPELNFNAELNSFSIADRINRMWVEEAIE